MSEFIELAERCEKATGPDRELDLAIELLLEAGGYDYPADNWRKDAPHYTASLDAAIGLVPEGWDGALYLATPSTGPSIQLETERMRQNLTAMGRDPFCPIEGGGATLALALCAASLRARAAGEDS